MPLAEQRCETQNKLPTLTKLPLISRVIDRIDTFLIPDLDYSKLSQVDIIVVHGGSGMQGVATGMVFQDLMDTAKRGRYYPDSCGEYPESPEGVDFRPLILFTGLWSRNISDDEKPRLRNGQITSQATYMKEIASRWGVTDKLLLTEDCSKGARSSVVNSLLVEYLGDPSTW